MIDGLTTIANRRYFDVHLDEEWRRARREGEPLAVVMMDLDHFKSYNDRYGHGVGDECLAQVAGTLAHNLVRPTDRVARYGGEEFVALLPQTDLEGAMTVAERLRKAVEELGRPHERSAVAPVVTISVGVAAMEDDDAPATLLKRADEALYLAKEGGRNRCCSKASQAGAAAAPPGGLRGVCPGRGEGYNGTLRRDDGPQP